MEGKRCNPFAITGNPVAVGTGLVALDVVVADDRQDDRRYFAGGTCGNVLTILSYLGWDAYPVARFNSDPAARQVLADLTRWGVKLDFAKTRPAGDTPIIIEKIRHRPDGTTSHRFSFTCLDCGAWLPGYKAVIHQAALEVAAKMRAPKVFFMDRVSRGAIILAKASAAKGAVVIFEPSGVGEPRLFREALAVAHVLKYSNERMNELSGLQAATGPSIVIETLGSEGLRYQSAFPNNRTSAWQHISARKPIAVADAAGAGDWCTAGLVHALCQSGMKGLKEATGDELQAGLDFGQALAAWKCEFQGPRGGMYYVNKKVFILEVSQILAGQREKTNRSGNNKQHGAKAECLSPCCASKHRNGRKLKNTRPVERTSK